MATPEGRVKAAIVKYLKSVDGLFYWMPVPSGFGQSGLDFEGCYKGRAFYVEAKAPGKKPTERQEMLIAARRRAGAPVFVIDGDLAELKAWVGQVG